MHKRSKKGKQLEALIHLIHDLDGELHEIGKSFGAVDAEGSSNWGFLQQICGDEKLTAVDLSLRCRVSRQYISRFSQKLEEEGLVTFQDNPRHKRSHFIVPTEKGRSMYQSSHNEVIKLAEMLGKRVNGQVLGNVVVGLQSISDSLKEFHTDVLNK